MNNNNELTMTLSTYPGTDLFQQEVVHLEEVDKNCFRVIRIPSKLFGFTYGDVICEHQGKFKIRQRGGFISCRIYGRKLFSDEKLDDVNSFVRSQGGVFEVFANTQNRFLYLVALPISLGWKTIQGFCDHDFQRNRWEYTNVYNANGEFIEWWKGKKVDFEIIRCDLKKH